MNLSKNSKLTKVLALSASAGTALDTASVDMQGFEGAMFFGRVASEDAGNFAHLAQSSDDSTFVDLAGTRVVTGDDADSFLIDIYRPTDRYVRCELVRAGTNTIVGDIYCIQYGAKTMPTSQGSTIDAETHISPAEAAAGAGA